MPVRDIGAELSRAKAQAVAQLECAGTARKSARSPSRPSGAAFEATAAAEQHKGDAAAVATLKRRVDELEQQNAALQGRCGRAAAAEAAAVQAAEAAESARVKERALSLEFEEHLKRTEAELACAQHDFSVLKGVVDQLTDATAEMRQRTADAVRSADAAEADAAAVRSQAQALERDAADAKCALHALREEALKRDAELTAAQMACQASDAAVKTLNEQMRCAAERVRDLEQALAASDELLAQACGVANETTAERAEALARAPLPPVGPLPADSDDDVAGPDVAAVAILPRAPLVPVADAVAAAIACLETQLRGAQEELAELAAMEVAIPCGEEARDAIQVHVTSVAAEAGLVDELAIAQSRVRELEAQLNAATAAATSRRRPRDAPGRAATEVATACTVCRRAFGRAGVAKCASCGGPAVHTACLGGVGHTPVCLRCQQRSA